MQERQQAEGALSGALHGLMIAVEAYPDLKASANFIQLQEELTGTENKIAFARQHYNDVVAVYNSLRLSFPASMVANSGGFAPEEYFEIDIPAERDVPRVQF
jgi:LemA protein